MNLMEKVFLQSQVSIHDFSEILEAMQPQLGYKILTSMYSVLSSGCFEEFRLFKYKMHYMDSVCSDLPNGIHCPLCPEDDGILIESMDACMGLVRKKCKGSAGLLEPRHGTLIFSDQNDVDNFVDNYQKEVKHNENCSRFHAGEVLSSLRSKGRNKVFDEKGVFGRVCRHDFPKGFINLKHGERISYSIYELKRLRESISDKPNIKVIVMYDIACILFSHLKSTSQDDLLTNISIAIPIFHCYGHKASCQVEYNPRRVEGVGMTDGEGVERLWSYLRGFAAMTKEMGAEKRIDVLTDALVFYGQKLCKKFGVTLKNRLTRTKEQVSTIQKELKNTMDSLQINNDLIQEWKSAEIEAIKPQENVLEFTWDELYVSILLEIQQIKGDLLFHADIDADTIQASRKKMKRKEKELASIEKKHRIKNRWKATDGAFENAKQRLLSKQRSALILKLHRLASERVFLIEMKKKYADGQGVAIKLSNQIAKASNAMQKCLSSLNAFDEKQLKFEDIKDPENELYCIIADSTETHDIPQATKKQLVDLMCLYERCNEEIDLLKIEAIRLFSHYFKQIKVINDYIHLIGTSQCEQGLKALLLGKRLCIENDLVHLQKKLEGLNVSPYVFEKVIYFSTLSGYKEAVSNEDTFVDEETEVVDDFVTPGDVNDDDDDNVWDSSDSDDDYS